ncbi:hypothetical protein [Escherichia phage vB_EcoM-LTH01]|nr:hypothetical protein [Escherichia phage UPEC06]
MSNDLSSHAVMGPGGALIGIAITKGIANEIIMEFQKKGRTGYYATPVESWMLDYFKDDTEEA